MPFLMSHADSRKPTEPNGNKINCHVVPSVAIATKTITKAIPRQAKVSRNASIIFLIFFGESEQRQTNKTIIAHNAAHINIIAAVSRVKNM